MHRLIHTATQETYFWMGGDRSVEGERYIIVNRVLCGRVVEMRASEFKHSGQCLCRTQRESKS
jgi:hypothetical protein